MPFPAVSQRRAEWLSQTMYAESSDDETTLGGDALNLPIDLDTGTSPEPKQNTGRGFGAAEAVAAGTASASATTTSTSTTHVPPSNQSQSSRSCIKELDEYDDGDSENDDEDDDDSATTCQSMDLLSHYTPAPVKLPNMAVEERSSSRSSSGISSHSSCGSGGGKITTTTDVAATNVATNVNVTVDDGNGNKNIKECALDMLADAASGQALQLRAAAPSATVTHSVTALHTMQLPTPTATSNQGFASSHQTLGNHATSPQPPSHRSEEDLASPSASSERPTKMMFSPASQTLNMLDSLNNATQDDLFLSTSSFKPKPAKAKASTCTLPNLNMNVNTKATNAIVIAKPKPKPKTTKTKPTAPSVLQVARKEHTHNQQPQPHSTTATTLTHNDSGEPRTTKRVNFSQTEERVTFHTRNDSEFSQQPTVVSVSRSTQDSSTSSVVVVASASASATNSQASSSKSSKSQQGLNKNKNPMSSWLTTATRKQNQNQTPEKSSCSPAVPVSVSASVPISASDKEKKKKTTTNMNSNISAVHASAATTANKSSTTQSCSATKTPTLASSLAPNNVPTLPLWSSGAPAEAKKSVPSPAPAPTVKQLNGSGPQKRASAPSDATTTAAGTTTNIPTTTTVKMTAADLVVQCGECACVGQDQRKGNSQPTTANQQQQQRHHSLCQHHPDFDEYVLEMTRSGAVRGCLSCRNQLKYDFNHSNETSAATVRVHAKNCRQHPDYEKNLVEARHRQSQLQIKSQQQRATNKASASMIPVPTKKKQTQTKTTKSSYMNNHHKKRSPSLLLVKSPNNKKRKLDRPPATNNNNTNSNTNNNDGINGMIMIVQACDLEQGLRVGCQQCARIRNIGKVYADKCHQANCPLRPKEFQRGIEFANCAKCKSMLEAHRHQQGSVQVSMRGVGGTSHVNTCPNRPVNKGGVVVRVVNEVGGDRGIDNGGGASARSYHGHNKRNVSGSGGAIISATKSILPNAKKALHMRAANRPQSNTATDVHAPVPTAPAPPLIKNTNRKRITLRTCDLQKGGLAAGGSRNGYCYECCYILTHHRISTRKTGHVPGCLVRTLEARHGAESAGCLKCQAELDSGGRRGDRRDRSTHHNPHCPNRQANRSKVIVHLVDGDGGGDLSDQNATNNNDTASAKAIQAKKGSTVMMTKKQASIQVPVPVDQDRINNRNSNNIHVNDCNMDFGDGDGVPDAGEDSDSDSDDDDDANSMVGNAVAPSSSLPLAKTRSKTKTKTLASLYAQSRRTDFGSPAHTVGAGATKTAAVSSTVAAMRAHTQRILSHGTTGIATSAVTTPAPTSTATSTSREARLALRTSQREVTPFATLDDRYQQPHQHQHRLHNHNHVHVTPSPAHFHAHSAPMLTAPTPGDTVARLSDGTPTWISCGNPWGDASHLEGDHVLLFNDSLQAYEAPLDAVVDVGVENDGSSQSQSPITPPRRYASDVLGVNSPYRQTHTVVMGGDGSGADAGGSGYTVLTLKRDNYAMRPWGFATCLHEFGGACLVTSVVPGSPAEQGVRSLLWRTVL
jgi:hypothetical protein